MYRESNSTDDVRWPSLRLNQLSACALIVDVTLLDQSKSSGLFRRTIPKSVLALPDRITPTCLLGGVKLCMTCAADTTSQFHTQTL